MRWWSPMSKTGFCWLWNHPLAWWILLWPTPKKRSLDSNLTTTLVVIYHGVYTDKTRGYNQSRIGAWEPNMDNHWGPAISVHFHPYLAKMLCIYIYIIVIYIYNYYHLLSNSLMRWNIAATLWSGPTFLATRCACKAGWTSTAWRRSRRWHRSHTFQIMGKSTQIVG